MDLSSLATTFGTALQTSTEGSSSFFSLEMILLILIGGAVVLGAIWITQRGSSSE